MGLPEMQARFDKVQGQATGLRNSIAMCVFDTPLDRNQPLKLLAELQLDHLEMELEFLAECIAIEHGG